MAELGRAVGFLAYVFGTATVLTVVGFWVAGLALWPMLRASQRTVYVVMVGDYDGDSPDAAFTTEAAAIAHRDALAQADREPVPCCYWVTECEIAT